MSQKLRTQVAIIGSGPAGLLLSELLRKAGIDAWVIDRQSRVHIEARIRAGVLEWGTVEALREAGVGARMDREGMVHSGFEMCFDGHRHRIDLAGLVDKKVMVYGQTELTKDLIAQRLDSGAPIVFSASNVQIDNVTSSAPRVRYEQAGKAHVRRRVHLPFYPATRNRRMHARMHTRAPVCACVRARCSKRRGGERAAPGTREEV